MSEKKKKSGLFGWFGKKEQTQSQEVDASELEDKAVETLDEQVSADESTAARNEEPIENFIDESKEELVATSEEVASDLLEEDVSEVIEIDQTSDSTIASEELIAEIKSEVMLEQDDLPIEQEAVEFDSAEELGASEIQDKVAEQPVKTGFFARLKSGLSRTRSQLTGGIADLVLGSKQIDDDLFEEIETQLLMADVGVAATRKIIDDLTEKAGRKELKDPQALMDRLRELLSEIIEPCSKPLELTKSPFVILMVGVNGVGKTTTIGKLAKKYQSEGKSVMLAAGDTFRAAAVEQLQVWGERNNIHVTAQHTGADSASVVFDALQAAQARNIDVLIADTAGRLHTKSNLMDELAKVVRVMQKIDPSAPHETMLVVDAGTGQNALSQAENFNKVVGLSGITITKLDGTAKGGVIFALADKLPIPIRFIGVGEGIDDLRQFSSKEFIDALFSREE